MAIMVTREQGKEKVKGLVQDFKDNIEQYKLVTYKEAEARIQFINKFFIALGWDVYNDSTCAEQYKEVVNEDAIKIGQNTKAPDYAFRIGGKRVFFVEAKKPSVNIKEDTEPSYQLRHYAWNVKIPLSILTDFEELAVYDCRIRPNHKDNASVARNLFLNYEQYIEQWDTLWNIFSKEAVLKGSFDRYVESSKGKKGTSEVDNEFLKEIESWRDNLAKNIALRNPHLTISELNYAVQKIIDKILFLIICEHRNIERYERLREIASKEDIYRNLKPYFKDADDKYNSGIFDLEHDKITPSLVIDDKVLRDIISELYYPKCPYNFSILPVEILGSVYEKFLGKTIRLTESHQAKVEEKPEVRKAGGVYYTPEYIVDYIVKNTVGKAIEGKSPKEIEKIRILDPACGSGTFLLRAYSYLMEYYLEFYSKNPLKHKKEIYQIKENQWFLTTEIRKKILLNNIFGVDIDPQAVELTKLSLLLKVLENETKESVNQQLKLFQEQALPNLDKNIRCGNSLIGSDYFRNKDLSLVANEEIQKVNAFDWEKGFPEIFKNGGFDAIIGNPPWVFTKYVEWGESTKDYIKDKYLCQREELGKSKARQSGKINLFAVFILRGIDLLKNGGLFGYIIPNNILRTTVYDIVRKSILEKTKIKQIVDLKAGVFDGVTASTVILLFEKGNRAKNMIKIIDQPTGITAIQEKGETINQDNFLNNTSYAFNIFVSPNEMLLFKKMKSVSINLGEVVNVYNGIATKKDKECIYDHPINNKCKSLLFGKDVHRYTYQFNNKYVEYDRKKLLRAREEFIFTAPEKLIMQRIGGILITAYDNRKYYTFNSINNILAREKCSYNIKFILGLLNSKAMQFFYIQNFTNKSNLTVNISKTYLDKLPIKNIDLSNPNEKSQHDKMVSLVNQMLEAQKLLNSAKGEPDKKLFQQKTDLLDEQINALVYELYGLNKDEIKIIENGK